MAKTGQTSDDRRHDFVRPDASSEIKEASWEELRAAVKAKGHRVEDMDQSTVVDTAIQEGLLDHARLQGSWDAAHPGPVDPANPPKGLPVEDLDPSSAELFEDMVIRDAAEAEGLDRNSDVETKADHLLATRYSADREVAEAVTGLGSTSGDSELRDEVANVGARTLAGRPDSPLDRATLELHASGETQHQEDAAREELIREHGYEEWQVASRSGEELQNLLDWHANHPDSSTTDGSSANGAAGEADVGGTASDAGTSHVGVGNQTTSDRGSSAGISTSEGSSGASSGAQGTETVTWVFSTGGEHYLGDNGKWYNASHQEVTNPQEIAELEQLHEGFLAAGGFDEPIGSFESQGTESSDTSSTATDGADHAAADANGDGTDSETSDDDDDGGSGDDDDGDDGDDGSGDSTSEDDGASGDASEASDEESESTAATSDEGMPGPDGHVPVDPVDQARFDASPFGRAQRQSEIDQIEGRIGRAGSPDDGPSDAQEADFLLTEAGAGQLEDLSDGVENNRNGGDADPIDLDVQETGGPVDEVAATGGGLIGPSEDAPTVGARGGPIEGVPEAIGGATPIAGPLGGPRSSESFGEGSLAAAALDDIEDGADDAGENGDGIAEEGTEGHAPVATEQPNWVEEADVNELVFDSAPNVVVEAEFDVEFDVVD